MSLKLEWGPDEGKMTWEEAVKLAASKGDGWRLPTVSELVSMFDYDMGKPKDASFQRDWYWSRSAFSGSSAYAWLVGFGVGSSHFYAVGGANRVRCVREVADISTDRSDESRKRYASELRALADRIEKKRDAMTPEQLDDYERLVSTAPFSPERTIIRALRASWADTEAAQTRATQAVTLMARTVERIMQSEELTDQLHKERDEARAEVAAAHVEAATYAARVVRLESEVRRLRVDLDEARHTIYEAKVAQGEAEQERDAAQAEMDEFAIAVGYGERPEGQSGVHRLHGEQLVDRWKQIERERDEAHAEVERLREVVGQVHGLVESAEHDYRALIPILDKLREIRKLTKEEP